MEKLTEERKVKLGLILNKRFKRELNDEELSIAYDNLMKFSILLISLDQDVKNNV